MIEINKNLCVGCAYCELVCPVDVIAVEGVAELVGTCIKCGKCAVICPVRAIKNLWK